MSPYLSTCGWKKNKTSCTPLIQTSATNVRAQLSPEFRSKCINASVIPVWNCQFQKIPSRNLNSKMWIVLLLGTSGKSPNDLCSAHLFVSPVDFGTKNRQFCCFRMVYQFEKIPNFGWTNTNPEFKVLAPNSGFEISVCLLLINHHGYWNPGRHMALSATHQEVCAVAGQTT